MGLYFGERRKTSVDYPPDNICRVGPPPYKKEQGFNIPSGSFNKEPVKDDNAGSKVKEETEKSIDTVIGHTPKKNSHDYRVN